MAAKKKAASKTAKKSAPKASNSPTTKSTAMSYIADQTGLTKKDLAEKMAKTSCSSSKSSS